MREKFARWSTQFTDDPVFAQNWSWKTWVIGQTMLWYVLAIVTPAPMAFIVIFPDPSGTLVTIGLCALFVPLLPVCIASLLPPERIPCWPQWRDATIAIHQLTLPALAPGETAVLSTIVRTDQVFRPRSGRLTLTTRGLIFQRPRLRLLPPFRPPRPRETALREIDRVGVDFRPFRRILTAREPYPVLRIDLRDGSQMSFVMFGANAWRDEILRRPQDSSQRSE